MHDSTLDTSSNHGGIIFPLEMFRASMLASALAEGLIAKVKNAVGAQLRMTRHATSPLVLARIEGDVVGGDEAAFWEENLDLTLYASQVLPRECFAYYAAQVPARKQGLLIAQRGQVIAGDQVTEDQMPPEATELDWPLPRLCEQLRITVAELAGGFEGGPTVTMSLMDPSVTEDEQALRTLAERPPEADEAGPRRRAPGARHRVRSRPGSPPQDPAPPPAPLRPRTRARRPRPQPRPPPRRRTTPSVAPWRPRRRRRVRSAGPGHVLGLELVRDEQGAVVVCDAELADHDLLAPYQIKKVRGDLPAGFDGALTDELMGKRVDFAVRVDFLSEVFVDDKPLSRPTFEAAATPLPGADDVMALEVLAPRLGRGTLLRRGRAGMFISRTPDLPVPSALLERLVE